ncbi:hypothetical protein DAI22_03g189500 [Oryza sativa Japonica Group]|nr:hypothetical protein DAI22_03g189500 [Oryza sativa Japonica Group]
MKAFERHRQAFLYRTEKHLNLVPRSIPVCILRQPMGHGSMRELLGSMHM